MRIAEPMTTLTDYLLGIATLWMAWRLAAQASAQDAAATWLFAGGFLASSVASFVGGSSHGLSLMIEPDAQHALWVVSLYAVAAASLLISAGVIASAVPAPLRWWLVGALVVKTLFLAVWIGGHPEFKYVVYDYALSMVVVLLVSLWGYAALGEAGYAWIAAGIVIAFVGAWVQRSGLSIHEQFNHNDLYHVIQLASFYALYRGASVVSAV